MVIYRVTGVSPKGLYCLPICPRFTCATLKFVLGKGMFENVNIWQKVLLLGLLWPCYNRKNDPSDYSPSGSGRTVADLNFQGMCGFGENSGGLRDGHNSQNLEQNPKKLEIFILLSLLYAAFWVLPASFGECPLKFISDFSSTLLPPRAHLAKQASRKIWSLQESNHSLGFLKRGTISQRQSIFSFTSA